MGYKEKETAEEQPKMGVEERIEQDEIILNDLPQIPQRELRTEDGKIKSLTPRIFEPVEDFAKEKASETISNAELSSLCSSMSS